MNFLQQFLSSCLNFFIFSWRQNWFKKMYLNCHLSIFFKFLQERWTSITFVSVLVQIMRFFNFFFSIFKRSKLIEIMKIVIRVIFVNFFSSTNIFLFYFTQINANDKNRRYIIPFSQFFHFFFLTEQNYGKLENLNS